MSLIDEQTTTQSYKYLKFLNPLKKSLKHKIVHLSYNYLENNNLSSRTLFGSGLKKAQLKLLQQY